MADIDVVKKSSKTWLWVLLVLVALVVIWFMMSGRDATPTGQLRDGAPPLAAGLLNPELAARG